MTARRKATKKKTGKTGGKKKKTPSEKPFPDVWMGIFAEAQTKSDDIKDFQKRIQTWLKLEIQELDDGGYRDDVQKALWASMDPRAQTGIQLGINLGFAIQAFDVALAGAKTNGDFELHPWVMSAWAATSIQAVRASGLSYWLTVERDWDKYVERLVSMLIPALGGPPSK